MLILDVFWHRCQLNFCNDSELVCRVHVGVGVRILPKLSGIKTLTALVALFEDGQPDKKIKGLLELEQLHKSKWRQGTGMRQRWGDAKSAYTQIQRLTNLSNATPGRGTITVKMMAQELEKERLASGTGFSTYVLQVLKKGGTALEASLA